MFRLLYLLSQTWSTVLTDLPPQLHAWTCSSFWSVQSTIIQKLHFYVKAGLRSCHYFLSPHLFDTNVCEAQLDAWVSDNNTDEKYYPPPMAKYLYVHCTHKHIIDFSCQWIIWEQVHLLAVPLHLLPLSSSSSPAPLSGSRCQQHLSQSPHRLRYLYSLLSHLLLHQERWGTHLKSLILKPHLKNSSQEKELEVLVAVAGPFIAEVDILVTPDHPLPHQTGTIRATNKLNYL